MSVVVAAQVSAPPAAAEIDLQGVGVRFDFDRRSRVVTPVLAHFRRIRATSWGLRDVDLRLEPGAGLALVGPTGSGKTTLLRILAGVLPADEGSVVVRGRIGSLLATEVGLQAMLTGRENSLLLGVLAGLSMGETRARMDEVAARAKLGDAFDRPIHTYSQGMRARLHLAAIQSVATDVLLLDEVFEALDHEFRAIVEAYARELRDRGGIVVAAGHDHAALERICPRAAWLERGRLRMEGPFAEVIPAYRSARPSDLD
jgi:ABC-2 type transport system ATP-binding protein/lipopolysaccharide transport system ATP-binding protein